MDLQHQSEKHHRLLASFPFLIRREFIYYALYFLLLLLITSVVLFDFLKPLQPQSLLHVTDFFLSSIKPKNGIPRLNTSSGELSCDYSNGKWVYDESYPRRLYSENCPFLDPGFRCHQSGRKDDDYVKWRWQPDGCDLPRFDATELLQRSRNERIVFVGDSIGRNQWESLICMLAQAVSNKSTVYEVHGIPITKQHKGSFSVRFEDYNLTIEYYRSPFLVTLDRPPKGSSEIVRGTIRVDTLQWQSKLWLGADVLVFNDGHWWNKDKTTGMGLYFREGNVVNMTMGVEEAFRRSLETWKSWAMNNAELQKSRIFFRSYSPVHYRDGTWNGGGHCDNNTAPESNYTKLECDPWNNKFISQIIKSMKGANKRVQFLNITYLSEFRHDGHPSVYREPGTPVPIIQDCSHWCLPGVPDTWNELLYANLLRKGFRTDSNV